MTEETITLTQLNDRLGENILKAASGTDIHILRYGKPVATITPYRGTTDEQPARDLTPWPWIGLIAPWDTQDSHGRSLKRIDPIPRRGLPLSLVRAPAGQAAAVPIGRIDEVWSTTEGIMGAGFISPELPHGADTIDRIRDKNLHNISPLFLAPHVRLIDDSVWELLGASLSFDAVFPGTEIFERTIV